MKNTLKIIGIVAILAIIGFSMTACGEIASGITFTVSNEYEKEITNIKVVQITGVFGNEKTLLDEKVTLANGETSKSFSVEPTDDAKLRINVTNSGVNFGAEYFNTSWKVGDNIKLVLTSGNELKKK